MGWKRIGKWAIMISLAAAIGVPYIVSAGTESGSFDSAAQQSAAERMRALQLIVGNAKGDLALNNNITRAELVTIIVRSFGQNEQAVLLKGAPSFSDVGANQWYSGYVASAKKMAGDLGTTLGMPNGTFDPNGKVTPAQALVFVMKFLGVQPAADSKDWVENHIAAAIKNGLISKEDGEAIRANKNDSATRGLVFTLLDKGFSANVLDGGKSVYTTYVDTKPPTITVNTTPATSEQASVTVSGTAAEASFVSISGNRVPVGKDGKWSGVLKLNPACGDKYQIVAFDLAGNTAKKEVTIKMTGNVKSVVGDVYAACPAP